MQLKSLAQINNVLNDINKSSKTDYDFNSIGKKIYL